MTQTLPATINGRNCYAGGSAPALALIAFYSAFNRRDPEAMARCWAQNDEISISNRGAVAAAAPLPSPETTGGKP